MANVDSRTSTAHDSVLTHLQSSPPTAASLSEEIGYLRGKAKQTYSDSGRLHGKALEVAWRERTANCARSSVRELLNELADKGFAWRDVARMVGVSIPAVRKWRQGEAATGDNRLKLAAIVAACEHIEEAYIVSEVASWFETPIHLDAPLTPIDLWVGRRSDLVLEYASGHTEPNSILDRFDPEWRDAYRSDFVSFVGADGNVSLTTRR